MRGLRAGEWHAHFGFAVALLQLVRRGVAKDLVRLPAAVSNQREFLRPAIYEHAEDGCCAVVHAHPAPQFVFILDLEAEAAQLQTRLEGMLLERLKG